MPKIAEYSSREIFQLQDQLRSALHNCQSLEEAAQWLASMFFTQFDDSVVLARCFVTIPYKLLPEFNRQFVHSLTRHHAVQEQLLDETTVLTLLGTRGVNSLWNDRRLSEGHIGIPLISADFVDSIPMVARLLKELEIDLAWLERQDMSFVERKQAGGWISVFYVRDAASALDQQGRHVIPAQDFVLENGIKTVFGLGGVYADGTMLSMLVFSRDEIDKEVIETYMPLVTSIRVATSDLVKGRRFFA